jgi:hypothetical protein
MFMSTAILGQSKPNETVLLRLNPNQIAASEAVLENPGSTVDELVMLTGRPKEFYLRWLPELMNFTVQAGPVKRGTSQITFWPIED